MVTVSALVKPEPTVKVPVSVTAVMPAACAKAPSVTPAVEVSVSTEVTLVKAASSVAALMVMMSVPSPPAMVSSTVRLPAMVNVSAPVPPERLSPTTVLAVPVIASALELPMTINAPSSSAVPTTVNVPPPVRAEPSMVSDLVSAMLASFSVTLRLFVVLPVVVIDSIAVIPALPAWVIPAAVIS